MAHTRTRLGARFRGGILGLALLGWTLAGFAQTASEIIVDNASAQFGTVGEWTVSSGISGYYGSNYQLHAPNGTVPGARVTDNTDAGVAVTDAWTASSGISGFWGSNYLLHAAGTGTASVTWPLPGTGTNRVYARWTSLSGRATNAPYTVTHTAGQTVVTVNQQQNGGTWQLLGTFDLDANSRVTLTNNANGYVIADAVMAVPVTSPAANSATWTPVLPAAGNYDVYARWTSLGNRATNAPYTVTHTAGQTAVAVNQQQNGGTWQALGRFALAPGQVAVTLTDQANGYVIADAVRFVWAGPTGTQIYYLHSDALDTPRLVTDAAGTVVWRNLPLGEPFGTTPPEEDPDGNGVPFTLNLRFPGQYFDSETNTHYNYYRDYDPATGRYRQSDPIGLKGGINTYAYVNGNPLSNIDPLGLASGLRGFCIGPFCVPVFPPSGGGAAGQSSAGSTGDSTLDDALKGGEQCKKQDCPPCDPPVGTMCWTMDAGHEHKGMDPHFHTWQRNQDNSCVCYWNKKKARKFTFPEAPSAFLPCSSYGFYGN